MASFYHVVCLVIAALPFSCVAFPFDPSDVYVPQSRRGLPSRADWEGEYNISTDFDISYPSTGVTVAYTLDITNSTCNPDGSGDRPCMLVNNQYPGPTLRAQWGDFVEVTIINNMQDNGTSIHFHGVRQLNTPGSDGVNGITQCPVAPGGHSATYRFQATQHGTSWYHSHTSAQYGDGVLGPIVFEGPATADYDEDLGPYVLNDYFGTLTAWQVAALSQSSTQGPPLPSNILINGTAINPHGSGGDYNQVRIQSGKKYRLRLINASTINYLRVSLDGHEMLVIAADFIPIVPFTAESLLLGIGQRYDVVITANQTAASYWFRAISPNSCFGVASANSTAIWTYDNLTPSVPTSSAGADEASDCSDETFTSFWPGSVPSSSFAGSELSIDVLFESLTPGGDKVVVWTLNEPIAVNYSDPTIGYLMRGDSKVPAQYNAITTQGSNSWNYWLIVNNLTSIPLPHPMHLHGHDFYVIGSGVGKFDESASLDWSTPIRRDTQSVPGNGWLALAFKSDNPGIWLMHCHIAYHIAEGLGVQYIESSNDIKFPEMVQYNQTCEDWNTYARGQRQTEIGLGTDGSGLR